MTDDYFTEIERQIGALVEQGAHHRGGRREATLTRVPRVSVGTLAAAASVVLAIVIAAVALVTIHHRTAPSAVSTIPPETQSEIVPALVRDFKILRQPVTAADRLPARFEGDSVPGIERGEFQYSAQWQDGEAKPPTPAQVGLLPELARRVVIRGTGLSGWLIPGRHGMCWFTATTRPSKVDFPNEGVCAGVPGRRTIVDGARTNNLEQVDSGVAGLVTDRVRAIEVYQDGGHGRVVPLVDGFYVAPYPRDGNERIVAITSTGRVQIYPVPLPARYTRVVLAEVGRTVPRTSTPKLVVRGPKGLRASVSYVMTCRIRPGHSLNLGRTPFAITLPASVDLSFPLGSARIKACRAMTEVTAAPLTRVHTRAQIVLR